MQDYERRITDMEDAREKALQELTEYYEAKLQDKNMQLEQVSLACRKRMFPPPHLPSLPLHLPHQLTLSLTHHLSLLSPPPLISPLHSSLTPYPLPLLPHLTPPQTPKG